MSRAPSSRQVTVEKNGTCGSANVVASSTGASCSAASAVSGLWKPPDDLELDRAPCAGPLGGGDQRVDAIQRAAHDDLARAVVVRRPDALDAVAEPLDLGVVEADDGRHRARASRLPPLPWRGRARASGAPRCDRRSSLRPPSAAYSPTECPTT